MKPLLEIEDLSVRFPTRMGEFAALESLEMCVEKGEIHGLAGESGAGKSTVGAAIMGLLPATGYVASGKIDFNGTNLLTYDQQDWHRLRGDRISMIFQDPQTSLNPLLSISDQLIETIRQHRPIDYAEARRLTLNLLQETGIADAATRMDDYPHQFSGGMRQRVVIAMALCTEPELIIADEPTTALDVSIQKQVLGTIRSLCRERNIGIILITHDFGVINEIADRVTVLRHGKRVESGLARAVLGNPQQPYTQSLMAAVPRLDRRLQRFQGIVAEDKPNAQDSWQLAGASAEFATRWLLAGRSGDLGESACGRPDRETSVLSVRGLAVNFVVGESQWFRAKASVNALVNIDIDLSQGEVLGIVGESGSGKSTLAKTIVGLINPSAGHMKFAGKALPAGHRRSRNHISRRLIQMVFQDPYSSLNQRRTVEEILQEPVRFYRLAGRRAEIRRLVASVLELVEMPQRAMQKYPHQFSGGQRQRIAIARALVARPQFLICDEPTSALDVSIQAQILNLIKDLQQDLGLTVMFISHNLAVIRQMADRVAVLKEGVLVETTDNDQFFTSPQADYSKLLLRDTPSLDFAS